MLLARRNLFRDWTRFLLSVLGVAVSVGLILLLAGYRSGVYRQSSAYLENTPGTVIVAERGIRDFLGTTSVLPTSAKETVRTTSGVARAIPNDSQFVIFERHARKDGFFLIGYEPQTGLAPVIRPEPDFEAAAGIASHEDKVYPAWRRLAAASARCSSSSGRTRPEDRGTADLALHVLTRTLAEVAWLVRPRVRGPVLAHRATDARRRSRRPINLGDAAPGV